MHFVCCRRANDEEESQRSERQGSQQQGNGIAYSHEQTNELTI
jgi:hypothetical protein